jgi:alpha 1,3-glucosidase
MRAHGHIDYGNREPYYQSPNVQEAIKKSITLRYDLIHYLYTQFHMASTEGEPIMRPMYHEFPQD